MKRKTFPDGYKWPEWFYNYTKDMPTPRPVWYGFSVGILTVSVVGLFALIPHEDERWRYISSKILCVLFGLSAVFSWVGYMATMSREKPEELLDKYLQEKARADSYARDWSRDDLEQLKQHLQWQMNAWRNRADEVEELRQSTWWKRMFFMLFMDGYMKPDIRIPSYYAYLNYLSGFIERRLYEKIYRSKEKPDV